MAEFSHPLPKFPLPTDEQAAALRLTADYLTMIGTQTATSLLGCPPLDGDTRLLASVANSMLTGAALCAGLVELADQLAQT